MSKNIKRTRGHAQRTTEIDQNTVTLTFSEEVLRAMHRLEAAVHDSEHFDSDILENLRGLTSGKPIRVDYALSEMVLITKEAMRHIQKTGDERAKEALSYFTTKILTPVGNEPKTIALHRSPGRHR